MLAETGNERLAAFDEDGFLKDPYTWDNALAQEIARLDGLPTLSLAHWDVIHYLRDHYSKHHSLFPMHHVCSATGLGEHCISELFHDTKEAWRVAGLPNPGEEGKAYM